MEPSQSFMDFHLTRCCVLSAVALRSGVAKRRLAISRLVRRVCPNLSGIVRNCPKSSGIVRSGLKLSELMGIIRIYLNCPGLSGSVRNCPELSGTVPTRGITNRLWGNRLLATPERCSSWRPRRREPRPTDIRPARMSGSKAAQTNTKCRSVSAPCAITFQMSSCGTLQPILFRTLWYKKCRNLQHK